ncbi:MAG: phosphatase PAP2 family protein [Cytophagia bacterium]|jgi:undecaprenyl-diphosphatase|nr:phosphatase PAP2 family protein [Cytophagia bacterium]
MIILSNKFVWIPLYIFLTIWLWHFNNKSIIKNIILCITAVLISDFITSSIMKPFFERLRPCNDPYISEFINIVSGCGKKFSFASSHASTTFSLATIIYLLSDKKIKYLFLWSLLIGYSRVYLGVHFFMDIFIGFLVGFLTSIIIYRISKKFNKV